MSHLRQAGRAPWMRTWVAGAALAALAMACDPPPTAIPPGPTAIVAGPVREQPIAEAPAQPMADTDAGPVELVGEGSQAPAGDSGGAAGSPEASAGGGLVRDGGLCEKAIECASGVCEGQGCSPERKGICMSRNRSCTRDLRTYCGCDGQTFRGSGSCPGRRFSARSACK